MSYFSDYAAAFGENYARRSDFQERLRVWQPLLDQHARGAELAVDLGCGTGIFSFYLAEKGLRVVGVDGAEGMVRACEAERARRGLGNVRFVEGRLPDFAAADLEGAADLVISSSVLEYVPALAASLALCARLLKPGGVLIVSLPSGLSVNRAYQRLKYRLTGQPREYGYIRHYLSEGKFRRLAAPLGLTVERVAYYGH
ncbi:MAG: class I SAM-dependent methyltransferase, partial [Anaerolineales bacterium]|nr:class I SAM-dependent methyltransferase [Anaerolineales bacterium]